MTQHFLEYYRCPEPAIRFDLDGSLSPQAGYFQFGDGLTLYGKTTGIAAARHPSGDLKDTLPVVCTKSVEIKLPFDVDQVADYLRYERYLAEGINGSVRLSASPLIRDLYYLCRPLMPVSIRSVLQRIHLRGQLKNPFPGWPVDRTVDRLFEKLMELVLKANGNVAIPFIWFWPEGARAAFILTHDVESAAGVKFCSKLMDIDSEFGFRSSFQIVPEKRYEVTEAFLQEFKARGFEVNVHDLNHDGNLFREKEEFRRRAEKINQYAVRFGTRGFRSGALYRRLDWLDAFNISYDMSVPNVGHLDPQGGGCCTIMPYFVGNILEIPVTGTQDYSLFHILNEYSIELWKKQTEIIVKGNGIISLITHPDYLATSRANRTYRQLLSYLAYTCKAESVWATLPAEIDHWWRMRHNMKLVRAGDCWQIQGEGKERARLAYACLVDGRVAYTFDVPPSQCFPVYSVATEGNVATPNVVQVGGNFLSGSRKHLSSSADRQIPGESRHPTGFWNEVQIAQEDAAMQIPMMEQRELSPRAADSKSQDQRKRKLQRPLHVGVVAYTFYESDNRVMRYAETLAREGHEVEVFALSQEGSPKEEVLCGVKVFRLQGRLVNEKTLFSYIWRILLFFMRALFQLSVRDLKRKYDLVHVHSVPDLLVFTALVPRLRGTPVILDIHDILPEFYAAKFGSRKDSRVFRLLCYVERMCAKFASHVIIANHIWKERLESRSVEPVKCSVVLNSPDRAIFQPSLERPAKSERFLLLYPGTLNLHQGLDVAIRAFARISAQVPYADFHIYGEGPLKAQLATLIKELGLEGRVVLFEMKPLREIAEVMATADIGIVPKRKDNFGNEAFSTKIFEFMAVGVPVIVSDTRIDQYYFNDSLVRFFHSGDDEDLARNMLDLIQHPEKRRVLVENTSEFIAKNDWTAKKQEYLELVARLTKRCAT